jgi:hypothetical protein
LRLRPDYDTANDPFPLHFTASNIQWIIIERATVHKPPLTRRMQEKILKTQNKATTTKINTGRITSF